MRSFNLFKLQRSLGVQLKLRISYFVLFAFVRFMARTVQCNFVSSVLLFYSVIKKQYSDARVLEVCGQRIEAFFLTNYTQFQISRILRMDSLLFFLFFYDYSEKASRLPPSIDDTVLWIL